MSEEHFPDPEGYPILAALVTQEVEHDDHTTTSRLYVCEIIARECGSREPRGPLSYRVILRTFWDGVTKQETPDWLYSSWHAFEAWRRFAKAECPMQPRQLEILATEAAKEAA